MVGGGGGYLGALVVGGGGGYLGALVVGGGGGGYLGAGADGRGL